MGVAEGVVSRGTGGVRRAGTIASVARAYATGEFLRKAVWFFRLADCGLSHNAGVKPPRPPPPFDIFFVDESTRMKFILALPLPDHVLSPIPLLPERE